MPQPTNTPIRRVVVLTLGCKLNQADSEAIARELAARGCQVTGRAERADAYVINTCSVTHVADRKSRHLVRLARRLGGGAPVILTGCYPETAGADAASAAGADVVLANRDKLAVVDAILSGSAFALGEHSRALRTRAFVKVQEGCNDVCSFCIVPRTRGRERSVPIAEVVAEVARRAAEGVQEVVLTGTQLGAYGRDSGIGGPAHLIRTVLAGTSVPRIRFSSLQPQDITPELLDLWRDPRLCRHFHLALQSGCDATLARMRRRYTVRQYREAVGAIRAAVRGAAITTDVIAGFPGESESEFEESLAFCREMVFAGVHVFPYSRRRGTVADRMPGQVADAVKKARVARMREVAAESAARFCQTHVGRIAPVLWEERKGGQWEGLTDTYVRVRAASDVDLANRITSARITGSAGGFVIAEALA